VRGVVIGGTASGVGKTVATLAAITALGAEGYDVYPAKAGPDFIDPSHHEQVAGRPSRTLDAWLQREGGLRRNYPRSDPPDPSAEGASSTDAASSDICVVEGVMGLYDGDGSSTARVADILDLPVVLVVDASAGMESVAATALGFREYAAHAGRDIDVAGIIAQRCHGGRHEQGVRDALPEGIAYLGRIPPMDALEIPDRHLGLHMGTESPLPTSALSEAATHLDAAAIADLAQEPPASPSTPQTEPDPTTSGSSDATGARVAVAQDAAFCFCYPATMERLRERAEVVPFAPTTDDVLPDCDAVYLPGGYPERHAATLAESGALEALADRAVEGLPVLGECGGFMALARSLTTNDGETHEMAGVLPADVTMHNRYQALDHVELEASGDTLTAATGETLRGHEFHYSAAAVDDGATFAFDVARGDGIKDGKDGLTAHRTLGTYAHVHPASGAFDTFLDHL
jgi:cobyrinic acid a,c-diamide synthase